VCRRGIHGDTRAILEARQRFLSGGHYSPIAALVGELMPDDASLRLLDSGTGTGYYLGSVLEARPDWHALALDVSVDAVTMAVRATGAAGLVADVWQPLPVRDAAADVVLCVFAPRNAAEFARVLSAGGRLIVVTPAPGHLAELRQEGSVIGIQPDKLEHLDAALDGSFVLEERRSLEFTMALGPEDVRALVGMGPSGHHDGLEAASEGVRPVGVAVDVSVYRRA
jgi:23S rRNA (guanine745-N1)-methyltransferase